MSAHEAEPGRLAPVVRVPAYAPERAAGEVRLRLDRNEGRAPKALVELVATLGGAELLERYPDDLPLRRRLAELHGLPLDSVRVFAGVDEALDRLCRSHLAPGRNLLTATPTFEMLPRYAALAGAEFRSVAWTSARLPTAELIAAADAHTALVIVVSPNNPTGGTATAEDLLALRRSLPQALLVVDAAYDEFDQPGLASTARSFERTVVLTTFSKAHGLAGLRVGYATGPSDVLDAMSRAGSPYPVSSVSLEIARRALESSGEHLDWTRRRAAQERGALRDELARLGIRTLPSRANFVSLEVPRAEFVHAALASKGVAVRRFDSWPGWLRITCPLDPAQFEELRTALRAVFDPEGGADR